jgi:stage IV sporulation protein FB
MVVVLGYLAVINVMVLSFNLIPAFPLDGGRVLRALLSLGLGHLRATEVAATLALFLAGGLVLTGFFRGIPSLMIVPFVIAFAGQAELHALRQRHRPRVSKPEIVIETPPVMPGAAPPQMEGFTGFVWDRDNGVWVRWVNGRPIDIC